MNLRVIWSGLGVLGLLGLVGWGLCHPHLVTGRGGTCLPVPTRLDIPPPGYIPLVVVTGGGDAGSCRVELESNAVHDMAQDLTTCVDGQITTGIDADWYRLSACEGPIDLELVLESDGAVALYLYGDPPGTPLAASESRTGLENIAVTNLVTGTYYAVVLPAIGSPEGPAMGIPYMLSVVETTWAE